MPFEISGLQVTKLILFWKFLLYLHSAVWQNYLIKLNPGLHRHSQLAWKLLKLDEMLLAGKCSNFRVFFTFFFFHWMFHSLRLFLFMVRNESYTCRDSRKVHLFLADRDKIIEPLNSSVVFTDTQAQLLFWFFIFKSLDVHGSCEKAGVSEHWLTK